jgi:hypothetical protein
VVSIQRRVFFHKVVFYECYYVLISKLRLSIDDEPYILPIQAAITITETVSGVYITMPLRDILKKKDKLPEDAIPPPPPIPDEPEFQFTFMRSDTHTQEIISPPTFSSADSYNTMTDGKQDSRLSSLFKGRSRTTSNASGASVSSRGSDRSKSNSDHRRLSQRLHLKRSVSSNNVPADLPEITVEDDSADTTGIESQWEARATILAKKNEQQRSRPSTPVGSVTDLGNFGDLTMGGSPGREKGVVSSQHVDDNIQEAIRLHEAGELEASTQMFGRLADPEGENNALSQVLYGLALRYVNWLLMQLSSQSALSSNPIL